MSLIDTVDQTTIHLLTHKRYALYTMLADLAFFVLYGFTMSLLLDPTSAALTRFFGGQNETILGLFSNPFFLEAAGWILLTFFTLYVLFCVLEGTAFLLTHRITGKTISLSVYLQRFSIASIPWFLLFIIYEVLAFLRDYTSQTTGSVSAWTGWILSGYVLVLMYFAGVQYAHIVTHPLSFSAAIKQGIHHAPIPVVVLLLVVGLVMDLVFKVILPSTWWEIALRATLFLLWILSARTLWVIANEQKHIPA